jgi:CRP-like cAMP-binding protein
MMAAPCQGSARGKSMMAKNNTTKRPGSPNVLAAMPSPVAPNLTYEDFNFEHVKADLRTIRKNKDVVVAGQRYETLFVTQDGWLCRYKILSNGARQVLDFILPGQIFGMQACLFNTALYSVSAITESSISAIPFDMIDSVFERSPGLAKALFWSAACESAILGEHLIDTARRSAYERVSHLLLELFVRLRAAGLADGMSFHMPLTQELIGDALGLTTVHVNRTLRSLREDKLIAIAGKRVTLVDFEALSLLSNFENLYLHESAHALRRGTILPKADGASRGAPVPRTTPPKRKTPPEPRPHADSAPHLRVMSR